MKTLFLLSVSSVTCLVALRLAGITTEIPALDEWVVTFMTAFGLR